MSWEALAWIWEQDISPAAAKLVAVCIADGADENGCRYPSYSYLAKRCNLSVDTVRAHIRTLVETGVLEKTPRTRENGSQSSNLYRVVAYPPLGAAPQGGCEPLHTPPVDSSTPQNHSVETSENPTPLPLALLPDPVDEVWALYESLLRQRSRKPSPKERKWISDAIGVCGVEQVKEAVQGLAASEYHRQGGYTGIGYAIRPNRDETIDGRVTKMAAKAPRRGPSALKVLLADRSPEARDVIYGKISDVERAATSPSEMNTRIGEEAEEWLRRVAKLAVVSRDGGRFEWGRA